MNQRPLREFVSGQFAEEEVRLHRPQPAKYPGKLEGFHRPRPEHVDRLRVIAIQQRAAYAASPPKALFASRQCPAANIGRYIRVQQSELIHRRNGSRWLQGIAVGGGNRFTSCQRKSRARRGVLELSTDVDGEPSSSSIAREAVIRVEALLIGAAGVIDNRLAEMIAVIQWLAADFRRICINRFQANRLFFALSGENGILGLKLFLQRCVKPIAFPASGSPAAMLSPAS